MACTSGCATQDHTSWGECMRAKSLRIAYCNSAAGSDATRQKRFDAENARYRDAVSAGLNPTSVRESAVNAAYDAASKG